MFQLSERNSKGELKPMPHSNTIYRQLFTPGLRNIFSRLAIKHDSDRKTSRLKTWNQFMAVLFAQLTGRVSLRDAATGFNSGIKKLYHLGAEPIVYNTLAHANKTRPWQLYQDLAQEIYKLCCDARPQSKKFRFKSRLFIMDATVISLCLSLYPWAEYRTRKGAVKMHALLDWQGTLPAFAVITNGKTHELDAAWNPPVPPGSIVVFDRAYLDYAMLNHYNSKGVFFVTRLKSNSKWRVLASRKSDEKKGVTIDQDIRTIGASEHKYPQTLRHIRFRAADGNVYDFLTNRFDLAATTIAEIYKARWDIEIFFRWIKQNLKIKSFLGTSENAVLTQIWIAICAYLLLSWHKFTSGSPLALSRILSLIQLNIFSRHPLSYLLHEKWKEPFPPPAFTQLSLEVA
jgi:putative transposase